MKPAEEGQTGENFMRTLSFATLGLAMAVSTLAFAGAQAQPAANGQSATQKNATLVEWSPRCRKWHIRCSELHPRRGVRYRACLTVHGCG